MDLNKILDDALDEFDDENDVIVPTGVGSSASAQGTSSITSAAASAAPQYPSEQPAAAPSTAAPATSTARPAPKGLGGGFDPLKKKLKAAPKAAPQPQPDLPPDVQDLQKELLSLLDDLDFGDGNPPEGLMPPGMSPQDFAAGLSAAGGAADDAGPAGSSASTAAVLRSLAQATQRAVESTSQAGPSGAGAAGAGAGAGAAEGIPGLSGDYSGSEGMGMIVESIMKHLLSKEVLYQPMKDIRDQYPPWLDANRGKVEPEAFARYEAQHEVVARLVAQYEQDPDDFKVLMELLQQMQSYGQPPDDIVSEMHKQIGQDLPGLGEEGPGGLPAGLEGLLGGGPGGLAGLAGLGGPGGPGGDMDPEKCCIM